MFKQNLFNKSSKKTLYSVFFVISLLVSQTTSALPLSCPQLSTLDKNSIKSANIDWIADGDTIYTTTGEKLRLLQIDTPELNASKKHSNKPAEPFAQAAKKELANLIGKSNKIFWITDTISKDKYGRTLAFVFNDAGLLLNAQLVLTGFAHTFVLPPNQIYWQCIKESENLAHQEKRGIWSHAFFQSKNVKQVKANQGWQLVKGKLTQIINSKKYRWLVLDDSLWVGINRNDFKYFEKAQLNYQLGDSITLRGYAYLSHGKMRMKLQHPAMVLASSLIQ